MIAHELIHYSDQPLKTPISRPQEKTINGKPQGLWVSVEDNNGWKDWCLDNNFHLENLKVANTIELRKDANILHLSSEAQMHQFTAEYEIEQQIKTKHMRIIDIDWHAVSRKYQGIIIAPYQWECSLDREVIWYHGWNCSCGCIWDVDAILHFETDNLLKAP